MSHEACCTRNQAAAQWLGTSAFATYPDEVRGDANGRFDVDGRHADATSGRINQGLSRKRRLRKQAADSR